MLDFTGTQYVLTYLLTHLLTYTLTTFKAPVVQETSIFFKPIWESLGN